MTKTFTVTVANVIPVITAPANQTANEGASTLFDLGSFTDPGADSPWQVTIDWGDLTANTVFTEPTPGAITDKNHTYADNGTYTVTISVAEENGTGAAAVDQDVHGHRRQRDPRDHRARQPDGQRRRLDPVRSGQLHRPGR